jgi:PAS domain S-box-containing protein
MQIHEHTLQPVKANQKHRGEICEHRYAEKALLESEERHRCIFEAVPSAIGVADLEGNIVAANPSMEQITGYTLEELQIVGLEALYPDPKLRQELLAAVSEFGLVRDWEVQLKRKDGTTYDAVLNVKRIELGGQKRLLTNMRDITPRKQTEEKLWKSELKYRTLVEQSLQGVVIIQDSRIVFCNNAYADIFGYSVEELLSFSPKEVVALTHPEDQAFVFGCIDGRLAGKPVPPRYEFHGVKKDGAVCWLEVFGSLIEYEGRPAVQATFLDITERRQAMTALQESEERFRLIAETIDETFWMYDAEKGTTYISPAHERIWGCSRQHLFENPNSFYDFIHPDDRERVAANNATLVNAGQPFEHVYRIIRADGSIRHIWDRGFPIVDERGQIKRYVGAAQDITAWRSAEEALEESKDYLNRIINCTGDTIFVKDRNFRHVLVNEAMCAWTGKRREELLGKTAHELFPKTEMDPLLEQEKLVFETGKECIDVNEITDPQGNKRTLMTKKSLLSDEKGNNQIVGVVRDITELKRADEALRESEESYRTAIEHCNDGVAIARESINLFVNQKYVEMFGYDRPEEMVGKRASIIAHPDEIKRMEDMMVRRQRGESIPSRYELKGIRKDGETFDIEISATQTIYRGESVSLAFVRDITEPKHMEKERERLQEQVRQSQKLEAIGLLAGGVAHDFNNLLTVIKGYTDLAMEDLSPDDPRRQDLEQVKKAGQQATSLTSQLLAFGRKQILQPETLNLNEMVAEMSTMLRRLIGEDIDLVAIARPDLELIHADPGQVQQIIMNLAVNARDAMPQGGKLTIETANVDLDEAYVRGHPPVEKGPYVMLAISDNGIGMDSATQARIFEPFFTTKGQGKGTGLGLSTVYGIVKQSNGFIWVYSEPGKGTTFKIYFPRVEGKSAKIPTENKSESGFWGSETVLVVEDEESVRALACRILSGRGYNILEAPNGKEALRMVREYPGKIHLVLTDVVMPGMSGKELVSQLEALRPGIKALYISGYTDNAIVHHGTLDSAVAFLQKPFAVGSLAGKVREVIDSV